MTESVYSKVAKDGYNESTISIYSDQVRNTYEVTGITAIFLFCTGTILKMFSYFDADLLTVGVSLVIKVNGQLIIR